MRQKPDEITGMACRQRDADLAVVFHAADPRTVPGARIEHDERPLAPVDRGTLRWDNAHQAVIHWTRQRAPVEYEFGVEAQYVGRLAGVVLDIIVSALAQDIEQQNRALTCIDPVFERGVRPEKRPRRKRRRRFVRSHLYKLLWHHCFPIQERSIVAYQRALPRSGSTDERKEPRRKRTAPCRVCRSKTRSSAGRRAYAFFKNRRFHFR